MIRFWLLARTPSLSRKYKNRFAINPASIPPPAPIRPALASRVTSAESSTRGTGTRTSVAAATAAGCAAAAPDTVPEAALAAEAGGTRIDTPSTGRGKGAFAAEAASGVACPDRPAPSAPLATSRLRFLPALGILKSKGGGAGEALQISRRCIQDPSDALVATLDQGPRRSDFSEDGRVQSSSYAQMCGEGHGKGSQPRGMPQQIGSSPSKHGTGRSVGSGPCA